MLQLSSQLPPVGGGRFIPITRIAFTAVLLGLLAFAAACQRDPATVTMTTPNGSRLELPAGVNPVPLSTDIVEIHSGGQVHTVLAEVAQTPAQQERGLMFRTAMPEDAGMIFAYPEEKEGGFWMHNTRIPLSIAYADENGVIFQITDMVPCESPYASLCPGYRASHPFKYALEVNQGYFRARGIGAGDRIVQRRLSGTEPTISTSVSEED